MIEIVSEDGENVVQLLCGLRRGRVSQHSSIEAIQEHALPQYHMPYYHNVSRGIGRVGFLDARKSGDGLNWLTNLLGLSRLVSALQGSVIPGRHGCDARHSRAPWALQSGRPECHLRIIPHSLIMTAADQQAVNVSC